MAHKIMERQLTNPTKLKPKDDEYRNRLRRSRSLGSLHKAKSAATHNPDTVKWEHESGQFTWSMTQCTPKNEKDAEIEMREMNQIKSDIPGYNHYLEHHGTLPFICWILMCCGLCIPCCCFCCEYFEDYNQQKNKQTKHANITNRENESLLVANEQIAGNQPTVIPISSIAYSSYQSVESGQRNQQKYTK